MGEPTILTQSDIKSAKKYLYISLFLMDSSRFLLAFPIGCGGLREVYQPTDDQTMARRSSQIVVVFYSS